MSERHSSRRLYQHVAMHLMGTRAVGEQGYYARFMRSMWLRAAVEVCGHRDDFRRIVEVEGMNASVIGIIHPSDGHPQEEHAPDFGWFRPLSHNNTTWVRVWPDLEV